MRERKTFDKGPNGEPDFFCPICDTHPCWDGCTRQQLPDTLHMKASRAGMTPLQYAAERADVLARFPDSPAAREATALLAEQPAEDEGRSIYGPEATAQALRVVAGEQSAAAVLAAGPGGGGA